MELGFSAEQEQLRRTVRDFALRELLPRYTSWDRNGAFPRDLWRRMGELGLTGARVPAAYDGQEMPAVSTGIVAEEVARGDFNLSYGVLMPALCGEVLREHAAERVKREWMAPMARGEAVVGLALTEPGSGSDAKEMRSTARRDGDEWVLNGEKTGVSLMMAADALVLFAKTDPAAGARGVSAFLVPTALPGVSRTPLVDMGSRGIQRGSIFMDEVRLPADYLLGELNKGFYQVMQGFDFSRSIIGLMCLGAAAITLDETMAYVKQRQAFGRPLAQFEGVSFPIAEHAAHIEAAKWLCYRGLWLKDAGLPHTKEAAMAKYLAPKTAVDAIHECLLLHGHYGYTQELPIEQRLRDVIGLEIGDGTAQVSKIIIARELMGRESLPY
ncbi:MAG TPA: acyl-CoA dehydrogenase family protein [Dehalococcoidia bacterium]|nr:acyl-CoA dehydrogenase family protein [Dehalococcoidia bacterium]